MPYFPSPKSVFQDISRFTHRSSRLTFGVAGAAAATVVAVAGASAGATPALGAVINPAAVSPAAAVLAAGHASSPRLDANSGLVPFGPASPHAVPAHQPTLRVPVTAGSSSRRVATVQDPARSQPHATAQGDAAQQASAASTGQSGTGHSGTGQTHRHRHWHRHSAAAQPAKPYLIYDSVTPSAIPAHHQIATYATGGYAVPASQVAGRGPILWIDTRGTDPAAAALDVEPGCATPSVAANWVWHKLHHATHQIAILYTMRSEWPALQAAVNTLPHHMRTHIRWWIADPTGYNHIVPGASATQWYWGTGYDITTANPGF